MATAELEKDDDIVVLSFNGWLFEGYEDAKTALTGTILEELLVGAIDLLSEPGVVALGGQYANTQIYCRGLAEVARFLNGTSS